MGLASHERGVKRQLLSRYANAFHRAPWLSLAVHDMNFPYERTAIIKDGNVAVMSITQMPHLTHFDSYVEQLVSTCKTLMRSAKYVIFCIDDPASVPGAKVETQENRDTRRKEVNMPFTDDDYTLEDLLAVEKCGPIVQERKTRYRMFDELMRRVVSIIDAEIAMSYEEDSDYASSVPQGASLIVDGVDPRGANRPIGLVRVPSVIGTHPQLVRELKARRLRFELGEADLKMIDVERMLRALRNQNDSVLTIDAVLHDTIDTDALPIGILDHARRAVESVDKPADLPYSYVLFRERGKVAIEALGNSEKKRKRQEPLARKIQQSSCAGILLVDMSTLYRMLMCTFLGREWWTVPPKDRSINTQLMIGGWIMGGCDFCNKKANADVLFEASRGMSSRRSSNIPTTECVNPNVAREWCRSLHKMLQASGEHESRVTLKRRDELENIEHRQLACVAWTINYWFNEQFEHDDINEWLDQFDE
jgi:hypothetical protein